MTGSERTHIAHVIRGAMECHVIKQIRNSDHNPHEQYTTPTKYIRTYHNKMAVKFSPSVCTLGNYGGIPRVRVLMLL